MKSDMFERLLRNLSFTSSVSHPGPADTLVLLLFKEIIGIKGFIVKFSSLKLKVTLTLNSWLRLDIHKAIFLENKSFSATQRFASSVSENLR